MLKIKKDILSVDSQFKILVRDDQLKINNKWFRYDNQNKFVCGTENGNDLIDRMYNGSLKNLCFEFNYMFNVVKNLNASKNF